MKNTNNKNNLQLTTLHSPLQNGYKKTDIGIIPEDWEVKRLGKILKYEQPGKYIVKSTNYHDNGFIPVLTPGKTFILGYTDETEGIYRNVPVILFDDFTTASKYVTFPFKVKSSAVKLLSLRDGYYDLRFIFKKMQLIDYLISEGDHKRRWISEYQHIEIFLPPTLSEQQAIARVLSDVDKLIENLDRLIEKKKMIKKVAMQELLTGRKRLPGFAKKVGYKKAEIGIIPEDWEVKKLGDICSYQNGISLEKYFSNSDGFKVISIGNYSPDGKYIDNGTYIDRKYLPKVKKYILKKGQLTMILNDKTSTGNIIGKVLLIDTDNNYVFNQRTMKLVPKENIDPLYLFFLINSNILHAKIINLAKPGTQIYVNTDDIINLLIFYPKYKPEQQAIAQILSDMDAEIYALEKKKAKYEKIKKGMMEQLLTGKIRLKNKIKEVLK